MIDPLAEVVTLLRPSAPFAKMATAAGKWIARRAEAGRPFFCAIVAGTARLTVEGHEPLVLEQGDFVLVPAAFDFTVSSLEPPADGEETAYVFRADGEIRHGDPNASPDVRMLVGYCVFATPDAGLLVSLLPQLVHVRGEPTLTTLVTLVHAEFRARRPGRDVVLARLLDVLLIEALRSAPGNAASPGLVRGLADDRLAVAMRRMHEQPSASWTVAELAREAAMSRSAFFARFSRLLGVTPMEYLLGWRIALAKCLLRDGVTVGDVAARVGYSSASAFSVAFTRHVGRPPAHFARRDREAHDGPVTGVFNPGRTGAASVVALSAPRPGAGPLGCPMHQVAAQFPDVIETARLKLRAPELSDAEEMFASYTQDADVARYMVWHPHASLDDTREFAAACVAQWSAGPARSYAITLSTSGQFVGMLEARPRGHVVNIGYLLTRNQWGQGLMVEAIRAFAAIALQLPGIFRVEATCDVDNRPSARALEKSGFLLEGRLSRYTVHPNVSAEPRDCLIYAVCRS